MMRWIYVVTLLALLQPCALASEWGTAFSLLDQIELNVTELKTSAEEMKNSNSELQIIIAEQELLLEEWQLIWNDSYQLLRTQQDSLESCEKSLKVYRTTTIVLGAATASAILAAVLVGALR